MEKYYSTDISIPVIEIKANSAEEADELINKFLDIIAEVMSDKIRWEEADWEVQENTLDEATGVWITRKHSR
jgi:hypothetical protein